MYQKKIAYKDFLGNDRERTFLFNLTEAELVEMQSSVPGGLAEYGRRIIESQNVPEVMKLFKELILMSYGELSPDGDMFIKKDKDGHRLADDFAQTNAYVKLYMEFIEHPEEGAKFFNSVIPAEISEKAAAEEGHAYPPSIAKA
jgi:hypothetical protein